MIDINGLTEIQIYYENETVSTTLWVPSGRLQYCFDIKKKYVSYQSALLGYSWNDAGCNWQNRNLGVVYGHGRTVSSPNHTFFLGQG